MKPYEKIEFDKWLKFRDKCPRRVNRICWDRDMFPCKKDDKTYEGCYLWYTANYFRGLK